PFTVSPHLSVRDAKVRVIARETAPSHVDRIDARSSGPSVSPADELLDLFFVPLGEHLDGAVRPVLDPPGESEPARLALRRCPKIHSLHPSSHEQVHLLQRHRRHFLAKSRQTGNFGRSLGGPKAAAESCDRPWIPSPTRVSIADGDA